MTPEPAALFDRDGDLFVPTDLSRTGWNDHAQHGGPPAGLLATAIEQVPSRQAMAVTRITFDLLRAVPLSPIRLTTEVVKAGGRVEVVDAALHSEEREVARARALRIRTAAVALPDHDTEPAPDVPAPDELDTVAWPRWERGGDLLRFHRDAVEVRSVGNSFWTPGRGVSWLRLKYPVVAGVETSPLARVAALSDIANGNSMTIDPVEFGFVNPDITLYLSRPLHGEWLGMDGLAYQHETGIGLTDTALFDGDGVFGRVNQSQLIEPHRP